MHGLQQALFDLPRPSGIFVKKPVEICRNLIHQTASVSATLLQSFISKNVNKYVGPRYLVVVSIPIENGRKNPVCGTFHNAKVGLLAMQATKGMGCCFVVSILHLGHVFSPTVGAWSGRISTLDFIVNSGSILWYL